MRIVDPSVRDTVKNPYMRPFVCPFACVLPDRKLSCDRDPGSVYGYCTSYAAKMTVRRFPFTCTPMCIVEPPPKTGNPTRQFKVTEPLACLSNRCHFCVCWLASLSTHPDQAPNVRKHAESEDRESCRAGGEPASLKPPHPERGGEAGAANHIAWGRHPAPQHGT